MTNPSPNATVGTVHQSRPIGAVPGKATPAQLQAQMRPKKKPATKPAASKKTTTTAKGKGKPAPRKRVK